MSLKTRLGLLAGSSLAAAGLLALAPSLAAAQTCTPTAVTVSGSSSAADSVACSAGTFASGITYSSSGDLSVSMIANGAVVNSTITNNGVTLTGNGADSVTFNSSIGNLVGGAGTAGPVIDVTTDTGDITITTATVNGVQAGTTYGIFANSTGGGDITISRAANGVSNNVAGGEAAIAAITAGGNIAITAAGANTTGRLRGILAETSGAGTITLDIGSAVISSAVDGIATIDTEAGTGLTRININGGTTNGGLGPVIRSVSAGAVLVQQSASTNSTLSGRVDFSGVAGGVTWNGSDRGSWQGSGASVFSGAADTLNMGGGSLNGSIDFGSGADTFNVTTKPFASSFSATNSIIDFGSGADLLNVTSRLDTTDTTINFGADNDGMTVTGLFDANNSTLDFGAGADTFTQDGLMFWRGVGSIDNLEAFDNAGRILFGGALNFTGVIATDSLADDRMAMTSGVFTGSGDSEIVLDAFLGAHASQLGCAAAVVADCVDFTGAATAGSTAVTVNDISLSIDGGTLNSVVTLIEGSSAAEHFTLDPASTYYSETAAGPAIRKPVVAYYFVYDEANQRHALVGAPTAEPFQVATFATAAQETWRATTGSWLTRQADLRATPGGLEPARGVWVRIGAQAGEREAAASYQVEGLTFDYDLSQKQRIAHMVFGADLVGRAGWVAGGMVGFTRSDVEFDAGPTEAVTSGFTGGLYASYVAGPLFVDATANANILHVKADAPEMKLGLDVPMKFDLKSLGGQVEAGWRLGMNSGLFVEPLVGVSYVVTMIEDAEVPGGSGVFDFDEAKSLRIGGGARVGLDSELMGMAASYGLTARYWNESEGGSSATITTASGSSALLADELAGGFSEVSGSLNLYDADGGLSGFATLGGKFGDDYQAIDGSAGVRVRW